MHTSLTLGQNILVYCYFASPLVFMLAAFTLNRTVFWHLKFHKPVVWWLTFLQVMMFVALIGDLFYNEHDLLAAFYDVQALAVVTFFSIVFILLLTIRYSVGEYANDTPLGEPEPAAVQEPAPAEHVVDITV